MADETAEAGTSSQAAQQRQGANRRKVILRRRLAVAVVGVLLLAGLGFWLTRSPLLDVDEIQVIGASRTGADTVRETSGIQRGEPLWGLDQAGARRAIARLPWVKEVQSNSSWSGRVVFEVTERVPVGLVPVGDSWALADREGRVLEITATPPELPIVLSEQVAEPGGWLPQSSVALLEVSEALAVHQLDQITAVRRQDGRIVVELTAGGIVEWGGREGAEDKAATLATMLARADLSCLERVDLSVPELPVLTREPDCS